MDPLFIKTFWITLAMLWAALIILYFILTDRRSLERKGHHEKYIEYLRRSHLIRICVIAVVLPLLILLSAWLVYLFTGPLTRDVQLAYIVVVLIILVVPFKFIDERINQKRIRELALETREKIAVDLNYKTLHLIFNPLWEIILGPSALLYGIFYLRIEQWIVYLFLLIPWFMYLNIKGTRYQTRPYLRDNYTYLFAFNIFNFLFFLLYFTAYYLKKLQGFIEMGSSAPAVELSAGTVPLLLWLLVGFILIIALLGRVSLYLAQYRAFLRNIDSQGHATTSPFRKLLFFLSGVFLLLTISGTVLMTGLVRSQQTDVGVVRAKYLLHDFRGGCDTLLVIDNNRFHPELAGYEQQYPGELRMSCRIMLSTRSHEKDFNICCRSLFEELPVGIIVKFEVEEGSYITELVEY